MPRRRKDPSTTSFTSITTTTSTTTDKGLGIQLNKNRIIYGRLNTKKPENIITVKDYLNTARESNSPEEKDYDRYIEQVEYCDNELSMQSNVWPLLAKHPIRQATQQITISSGLRSRAPSRLGLAMPSQTFQKVTTGTSTHRTPVKHLVAHLRRLNITGPCQLSVLNGKVRMA